MKCGICGRTFTEKDVKRGAVREIQVNQKFYIPNMGWSYAIEKIYIHVRCPWRRTVNEVVVQ